MAARSAWAFAYTGLMHSILIEAVALASAGVPGKLLLDASMLVCCADVLVVAGVICAR